MGPVSKSAKKSKTPGQDGQKRSKVLQKKAQSEGGRVSKVKALVKAGSKSAKVKASKKMKRTEVAQGKKLSFDESDSEDEVTFKKITGAKGKKGKKTKTPKSSGKHTSNDEEMNESIPAGAKGKKSKTPKSSGKVDISNDEEEIENIPAGVIEKKTKTPKSSGKIHTSNDEGMNEIIRGAKGKKSKMPKSFGNTDISNDEETIAKKPVGVKGKKSKTPKLSGKVADASKEVAVGSPSVTPKGKKVREKVKVKKALSEGAKSKKSVVPVNVSRKVPASTGKKLKGTEGAKEEDLKPMLLTFGEDDYDEDEDSDFDVGDEFDVDSNSDSYSENTSYSDSDDSEMSFSSSGSDDNEVIINVSSGRNTVTDKASTSSIPETKSRKTPKSSSESETGAENSKKMDKKKAKTPKKDLESSKTPKSALKVSDNAGETNKPSKTPKAELKSTKVSKSAQKVSDDTEEMKKPSKTPKSALKTPGTAESTGKKVSIVVTSPAGDAEEKPKKPVTTPHPSLTKKRRRPMEDDEVDNDKENVDENVVASTSGAVEASPGMKASTKKQKPKPSSESESDEKPLSKQLSFGDEEEDEGGESGALKSKGPTEKRKMKKSRKDTVDGESEDDEPPEKKGRHDGFYYHCGNLPIDVDKRTVRLFFAEADVQLSGVHLKKETIERVEKVKHRKKELKKLKLKKKIDHCYATLKCASEEDAKKLEEMNGVDFAALKGKWRTYRLVIYPASRDPWNDDTEEDNCVFISRLNYKTEDQDLLKFFKEHGLEPQKVKIARRGIRALSKGYGFAWFQSQEDTEKALKLAGSELHDITLNICKAKPKKGKKQYSYKIGSNLDKK